MELDRLDPATLDDARLVEAFTSAAGLRDDARTARLAAELLNAQSAALRVARLTSVVSPLVRQAMGRDDYKAALSWLKEARSTQRRRPRKRSRSGARKYLRERVVRSRRWLFMSRLITPDAAGAALALDAAEMMLDNGHLDQAKVLLIMAADMAAARAGTWIEHRAGQLLDRMP